MTAIASSRKRAPAAELFEEPPATPRWTPRILALDMSLNSAGWAKTPDPGEPTRYGLLAPPKGFIGIARLRWMRAQVLQLTTSKTLGSVTFGAVPDLVVIEGYAYGAQGSAVISLGEMGGVIRVALEDAGLAWLAVNPSTVKTYATGSGIAKKDAVLAAAIRKLDYQGHSTDEADALWLLELTTAHYDGRALTADQKRAIEKVTWPELTHQDITRVVE